MDNAAPLWAWIASFGIIGLVAFGYAKMSERIERLEERFAIADRKLLQGEERLKFLESLKAERRYNAGTLERFDSPLEHDRVNTGGRRDPIPQARAPRVDPYVDKHLAFPEEAREGEEFVRTARGAWEGAQLAGLDAAAQKILDQAQRMAPGR